jgi:hypothetical protein
MKHYKFLVIVILFSCLFSCFKKSKENNSTDISYDEVRSNQIMLIDKNYNNFNSFEEFTNAYWFLINYRFAMQTNEIMHSNYYSNKYYLFLSEEIISHIDKFAPDYMSDCLGISFGLSQFGGVADDENNNALRESLFINYTLKYIDAIINIQAIKKYIIMESLSNVEYSLNNPKFVFYSVANGEIVSVNKVLSNLSKIEKEGNTQEKEIAIIYLNYFSNEITNIKNAP